MPGKIAWGAHFAPRAIFIVSSTAFSSCFPVRSRRRAKVQEAAREYWPALEQIAQIAVQRNAVRQDPHTHLRYEEHYEIDRETFEGIAIELGYDGRF